MPGVVATEVTAVSEAGSGEFTLARIGEPVQLDVLLLRQLRELGLTPGARVRIESNGQWFLAKLGADEGLNLDAAIAAHIFVSTQLA
jgi:DtxR family Mn-dependent transcriptional regulator